MSKYDKVIMYANEILKGHGYSEISIIAIKKRGNLYHFQVKHIESGIYLGWSKALTPYSLYLEAVFHYQNISNDVLRSNEWRSIAYKGSQIISYKDEENQADLIYNLTTFLTQLLSIDSRYEIDLMIQARRDENAKAQIESIAFAKELGLWADD